MKEIEIEKEIKESRESIVLKPSNVQGSQPQYQIFLSYRRRHIEECGGLKRDEVPPEVIMLKERLINAGYTVFLDIHDLSGDWRQRLHEAIIGCNLVIFVFTNEKDFDRCENTDDVVYSEIILAEAKKKKPRLLSYLPEYVFKEIVEKVNNNSLNERISKVINILLLRQVVHIEFQKTYAYQQYNQYITKLQEEIKPVNQPFTTDNRGAEIVFRSDTDCYVKMSKGTLFVEGKIYPGKQVKLTTGNYKFRYQSSEFPEVEKQEEIIITDNESHYEFDIKLQTDIDNLISFRKGSNPTYLNTLEKTADELNNKYAQNELGFCYSKGIGVEQDYEKAVRWYEKSAKQGYVFAQNNLGLCYYFGKGVEQDYKEATKWYEESAKQGNMLASFILGECYYWGNGGVTKSYEIAVDFFLKSADQGNAYAQNALGECYYNGHGVAQSYEEATKWYRKSAVQGNAKAKCNLGNCYYDGEGVEQSYKEAVKWYEESAEQGNDEAKCNLGDCYYNGEGVEQSYEEAVKWYRKSAVQGNAEAKCNLGNCYYNGEGVEQSYEEAVKWYKESAEQNNAGAQINLGNCYYEGEGVEQSCEEAVKWYRKSAEQGNATAQKNLGVCYEYGEGVEQSYEEAAKWYKESAEQGNTTAQYKLSNILINNNLEIDSDNGIYEKLAESLEKFNDDQRFRFEDVYFVLARLYEDRIEDNEKAALYYQKSIEKEEPKVHEARMNLASLYTDGLFGKENNKINYGKAIDLYDNELKDTPLSNDQVKELIESLLDIRENHYNELNSDSKQKIKTIIENFVERIETYYFTDSTNTVKLPDNIIEIINRIAKVTPDDSNILYIFGNLYNTGGYKGINKDYNQARNYYQKAAERGNPKAQYMFGYYLKKNIWQENSQNPLAFFEKSAQQGYAPAQYELGEYYRQRGENSKAIEWFTKAANQDYMPAKIELKSM